jgi:ATPase subunit of ABC transporter with duplicated ATPase domains
MHKPIQFKNLSLSFPHKTCFSDFSGQLLYGSRIAIIGSNGCGKSTLLKMLHGQLAPTDGDIYLPIDLTVGYLPQVIDSFDNLSGGQRLNSALTQALIGDPSLLLLDEPTNHLDNHHRRSLMRMLRNFPGTLVMVTHDVELLQHTSDTIWHIDQGRVHVFTGSYDDYQREMAIKRNSIEQTLASLNRQQKDMHQALMQEQTRAKNSRIRGEKHIQQRKWPTIRSATNVSHAVETAGLKQSAIKHQKQGVINQLSELRSPEVIKPKFALTAMVRNQALVSIGQGRVGYTEHQTVLSHINLNIGGYERVALLGENGSGKSTLIKAILGDASLVKEGEWHTPSANDIGYLDQHYATLQPDKTVLEVITDALPRATYLEVRKHLNDFLFRKNEEVQAMVSSLSGGEKARLSLAQIAAITPKLLILDEMTNNLDLETREHVIEVLRAYPGVLIAISHDVDFLQAIDITTYYQIRHGLIESVTENDDE